MNAAALAGLQGPIRFQPDDTRRLRPAFGPTPRRGLRADRNRFGFPVLMQYQGKIEKNDPKTGFLAALSEQMHRLAV